MAGAETFRQVGEFIDFSQRQIIRGPKNPMDKSTIISIFPKEINETKFTIEPGKFHIEPGTFEFPSRLVVSGSSWFREVDIDQPILEIPVPSVQIANSIIMDYCNGLLGCDMNSAMPGMFFVPGEFKVSEIVDRYKDKLKEVKMKQDNWFRILIRIGDSLWARANGNPLVISNEMRMAAIQLGFNDKPWIKDMQAVQMISCPACGNHRNPQFPVCPFCKNIDQSHPLAKDLKFAQ